MSRFKDKQEFEEFVAAKKVQDETEYKRKHDEKWANLRPFEKVTDVPNLPIVEKEEWDNFYAPRLIAAGAIPKKDLKDKEYYLGNHRRGHIAQWNTEENRFHYWREKFGSCFIDKCEHFEDYSQYAVFVPIAESTEADYNLTNTNPK